MQLVHKVMYCLQVQVEQEHQVQEHILTIDSQLANELTIPTLGANLTGGGYDIPGVGTVQQQQIRMVY